jgi:hypothetical protein
MSNLIRSIGLSVLQAALLAFLFIIPAQTQEMTWPLPGEIDLSDGFGDFRDGHFHAGVDLRTGGKIGARITAPVSGYISRINISYRGYGKGIYLTGDDGYLYVFGHLSVLAESIDKVAKARQVELQRYYVDFEPDRQAIPIAKGGFLGYSGQTGAGGPHLHFEKRVARGNIPLNPLTHGFELNDRIAPVFERVGFQQVDDHSLFDNGRRKLFVPASASGDGDFKIDTLLYFKAPFGLAVDVFDKMRAGGMRQAVQRLELYLDDQMIFRSVFDTLAFETTTAVRWEYDYVEAVTGQDRTRRLFLAAGRDPAGERSVPIGDGFIGQDGDLAVGKHHLRVVATDSYGNQSELDFDFLWIPEDGVYCLDSTVVVDEQTSDFYFTPCAGWDKLGIDSVFVMMNRGDQWGPPSGVKNLPLDNGRFKCRAVGGGIKSSILALAVHAGGAAIPGRIFNGLQDKAPDRCSISHEIVEDGLLVKITASVRKGARCKIVLYSGDDSLGVEYPQYFSMKEHFCFLPPKPEYQHIDRIGVTMTTDPEQRFGTFSDSMAVYQVGRKKKQTIHVDEYMSLHFRRDNFYGPRYIEVMSNRPGGRLAQELSSLHYQILPEAFVCRSNFEISLWDMRRGDRGWVSGLCWLNQKADKWVWITDRVANDTVFGASTGGGSFALVYDVEPPKIRRLSVAAGGSYADPYQKISFLLEDNLAGFADDRSIIVKLDGKWMIPEYNPGTKRFTAVPMSPLSPGEHHLAIEITDRAGLKTEQYLKFSTKKGKRH